MTRPGAAQPIRPGRLRNRREALEQALGQARSPRDFLAAASQYFRSVFARADPETAQRVSQMLIDMTDREAGNQP